MQVFITVGGKLKQKKFKKKGRFRSTLTLQVSVAGTRGSNPGPHCLPLTQVLGDGRRRQPPTNFSPSRLLILDM